ncbi:MAG: prolyl oligopeptidase family serine peptidase [Steroidobacteraceae bacterium]
MKHTTSLMASLCVLLLAPLLLAQSVTPARSEQGGLILDGIPARDPALAARLAPWLEARDTGFVDWLADGNLLVRSRAGESTQLQRVGAALETPAPITAEDEPVTAAAAHPYDVNTLLFLKDRGGDGNTQLLLRNLATGTDKLLTDGTSRNGLPVFARDGKRIAFDGNARDGASSDVYLRDTSSDAGPQLLMAGGKDALAVQDWSLDDRRLAVIRRISRTESQLLLVDTTSGVPTRVEPAAGYIGEPMSVTQARFSRDGHGLYFLSDRGGEFTALHYLDLYTSEVRTLTPDTHWDVQRFALSADGRYIAYTRNEASADRLVLHDVAGRADLLLPALPAGALISAIGFDHRSQQLAVAVETAQSPQDVYVYRIEPAPGDPAALPAISLVRWTQGEPSVGASSAVPELVQFPTWDRVGSQPRFLPAYVFRPRAPGAHPVVIDIRGTDLQARPQWNAFTQYLVNEGYAVVAPNVRGATGYGRSFLKLGDGTLRDDAVRDIGALLVWAGLQPDFDRTRVLVMDDSRGGYLGLAALANYGDRLRGAVVQDIAPFSNAVSIRKPLLIAEGRSDPGAPGESQLMTARLRGNGGEVWYLAAKNEGHGFQKKTNRDEYFSTVAAFVKRFTTP